MVLDVLSSSWSLNTYWRIHHYIKAEEIQILPPSVSCSGNSIAPRGIQMDPAKVSVVISRLAPTDCKQLQWILEFTNFHHLFIQHYSVVVAPLTTLTSIKAQFKKSTAAFGLDRLTSSPLSRGQKLKPYCMLCSPIICYLRKETMTLANIPLE